VIQIVPQMKILVAVEAVDARKGIDSLARLCQEKLQEDPFSGCLCVPEPARNLDPNSQLRWPGILVGAEAAVEVTIRVVAEREGKRHGGYRLTKRSCCWRRATQRQPQRQCGER
jgi:hypothetical protein